MPPHREIQSRVESYGDARRPRLWADLFTGLTVGVFLILLAAVLVGAWLYENGV